MYVEKRSKEAKLTFQPTTHSPALNSLTCANIYTGFVLYFQAQVANGNDYAHEHEHEHCDDQLVGESTCFIFYLET